MGALVFPCYSQDMPWDFSLFFEEIMETSEEQGLLELQGISYLESGNWVVWINGHRYSSERRLGGLQIHSVRSTRVTLEWLVDGETHHITLSPGQTYSAKERRIYQTKACALNP